MNDPVPAGDPPIGSRRDFQQAVRKAFAEAAESGCREFWLCDVDFAAWPLGERTVIADLGRWVGAQRRLHVYAADFDRVVRLHPRWVAWRREWAHAVDCRSPAESERGAVPTAMVVPGRLVIELDDSVDFRGRVSRDPADAVRMHDRLDALYNNRSRPFRRTSPVCRSLLWRTLYSEALRGTGFHAVADSAELPEVVSVVRTACGRPSPEDARRLHSNKFRGQTMKQSFLLASLVAALALTACSKKEEAPAAEAASAAAAPAVAEAASAAATAVTDAASAATTATAATADAASGSTSAAADAAKDAAAKAADAAKDAAGKAADAAKDSAKQSADAMKK